MWVAIGPLPLNFLKFSVMARNRRLTGLAGRCLTLLLDALFRHVITRHTLNPADTPLIAAVDRPLFLVGERGLRQQAGLHRHIVLDDDYFATDRTWYSANRLRDERSDRMTLHDYDGNLHTVTLRLLMAERSVFVMRG